jgi:hypothetical protein
MQICSAKMESAKAWGVRGVEMDGKGWKKIERDKDMKDAREEIQIWAPQDVTVACLRSSMGLEPSAFPGLVEILLVNSQVQEQPFIPHACRAVAVLRMIHVKVCLCCKCIRDMYTSLNCWSWLNIVELFSLRWLPSLLACHLPLEKGLSVSQLKSFVAHIQDSCVRKKLMKGGKRDRLDWTWKNQWEQKDR